MYSVIYYVLIVISLHNVMDGVCVNFVDELAFTFPPAQVLHQAGQIYIQHRFMLSDFCVR